MFITTWHGRDMVIPVTLVRVSFVTPRWWVQMAKKNQISVESDIQGRLLTLIYPSIGSAGLKWKLRIEWKISSRDRGRLMSERELTYLRSWRATGPACAADDVEAMRVRKGCHFPKV